MIIAIYSRKPLWYYLRRTYLFSARLSSNLSPKSRQISVKISSYFVLESLTFRSRFSLIFLDSFLYSRCIFRWLMFQWCESQSRNRSVLLLFYDHVRSCVLLGRFCHFCHILSARWCHHILMTVYQRILSLAVDFVSQVRMTFCHYLLLTVTDCRSVSQVKMTFCHYFLLTVTDCRACQSN